MLKEHINRWLNAINDSPVDIPLSCFDFQQHSDSLIIRLRGAPLLFMIRQLPDSFDDFVVGYSQFQPGYPTTISMDVLRCASLEGIDVQTAGQVERMLGCWLINVAQRYMNEQALPDPLSALGRRGVRSSSTTIGPEDL